MHALQYTWLHLRRNPLNAVITLTVSMTILLVIMSVQQMMISRYNTLADISAATRVRCVVTDGRGQRTDELLVDKRFYLPFVTESAYSPYVDEVYMKTTQRCQVKEQSLELIAVTDPTADFHLKYHPVSYEEGFDQRVWMSTEPVCALSLDLIDASYIAGDGERYVDLTGAFPVDVNAHGRADVIEISGMDYMRVPLTLRVVGVVPGEQKLYCPFLMLLQACGDYYDGINITLDSMSFTVRDNAKLDEFRELLAEKFLPADPNASAQDYIIGFSLTIQDSSYLLLTREAGRSLQLMRILQPILYLCALGTGALIVMIQMRARRWEIAVLRSMGTRKGMIAASCLLEYFLLCLPAAAVGLLLCTNMPPASVAGVVLTFLAGAGAAILHDTRRPIADQIRELEEK